MALSSRFGDVASTRTPRVANTQQNITFKVKGYDQKGGFVLGGILTPIQIKPGKPLEGVLAEYVRPTFDENGEPTTLVRFYTRPPAPEVPADRRPRSAIGLATKAGTGEAIGVGGYASIDSATVKGDEGGVLAVIGRGAHGIASVGQLNPGRSELSNEATPPKIIPLMGVLALYNPSRDERKAGKMASGAKLKQTATFLVTDRAFTIPAGAEGGYPALVKQCIANTKEWTDGMATTGAFAIIARRTEPGMTDGSSRVALSGGIYNVKDPASGKYVYPGEEGVYEAFESYARKSEGGQLLLSILNGDAEGDWQVTYVPGISPVLSSSINPFMEPKPGEKAPYDRSAACRVYDVRELKEGQGEQEIYVYGTGFAPFAGRLSLPDVIREEGEPIRFFDGDMDGVGRRARILPDLETPDMSDEHRLVTAQAGEFNGYLGSRYFEQEKLRQEAAAPTGQQAAPAGQQAGAHRAAEQPAGRQPVGPSPEDGEVPF